MKSTDKLESVPWGSLKDAYGSACDFPKWIRDFWTDDADVRMEVIYNFLSSRATHQFTLYSATPFVIPFAIEALGDEDLRLRDREYDPSIIVALLGFLRTCASSGEAAIYGGMVKGGPRIPDAIFGGVQVFEILSRDDDPDVARVAQWLTEYCRIQHTN